MSLMSFVLGFAAGGVATSALRRPRHRELDGAVVLITGASRGLGLALAEEFAHRGSRIAICARDETTLERARARLAALGADVFAQPCDVRDRAAVERFVMASTDHFGRVDVLVNNAGTMTMGPAHAIGTEAFEDAMATMFWGPLYATLAVLPQMRARGDGAIVNICSIGGKLAMPQLLSYSSAKFAMTGLSEGLHAELAAQGVSVLTVAPGLMRTGSPYNATFVGRPRTQFAVFNALGNLPLTSIDARRAAAEIVEAVRKRESELIVSPQARLVALMQGVAPGVISRLSGVAARFLPETALGEPAERASGWDSRSAASESFLTRLGQRAARDLQQTERTPSGEVA
jgi:short-subunit dehydrogenase